MSIAKAKEALEHLRDNEAYGPGAESIRKMANDGLAQMEAIEKAAKSLVAWNAKPRHEQAFDPDAARGFGVLESIAREAK